MTIEQQLEKIEKKMERQLSEGQKHEPTNDKYRKLIKQKLGL